MTDLECSMTASSAMKEYESLVSLYHAIFVFLPLYLLKCDSVAGVS